jgi:hypothetical protein
VSAHAVCVAQEAGAGEVQRERDEVVRTLGTCWPLGATARITWSHPPTITCGNRVGTHVWHNTMVYGYAPCRSVHRRQETRRWACACSPSIGGAVELGRPEISQRDDHRGCPRTAFCIHMGECRHARIHACLCNRAVVLGPSQIVDGWRRVDRRKTVEGVDAGARVDVETVETAVVGRTPNEARCRI